MSTPASAPATLIEAIQHSMAASLRSPDGVADPAALLWTDTDGQWRPLIPTLLKVAPQLYVLGPYDPGRAARPGHMAQVRC